MEKSISRIKELIQILNKASEAYYSGTNEIMSNFDYDKLYDELVLLEKTTNVVFSNSPTVNVGYEVSENLPKERHESKMLSLDKTKDLSELSSWLDDKYGIFSYKVDGLTIVLTYEQGVLVKAVTRGNGEVGEVVTQNAKVFKDIPLKIADKERLVVRGEAYIGYSDFEKINTQAEKEEGEQFKNPRNLCSGSVRQLNNEITKKRNVSFLAFNLVNREAASKIDELEYLKQLGFKVVPFEKVDAFNIEEKGLVLSERARESDIPTDGLVLTFDDIKYGNSLGVTAKFPRNAIAYKWADETAKTVLRRIEWSPSRTGLINPIAVFDPVELESTTVSRASVHNISILKELNLIIGDSIEVYKANMIIPQISRNLKEQLVDDSVIPIPKTCPVCNQETIIRNENSIETLFCVNENCPAKKVNELVHFMNRDALNIEGISEATVEKLIESRLVESLSDIFLLKNYKEEISLMEGFGQKSFENMINSIEKAKTVESYKLLYGLGIGGIGLANAKLISRKWGGDWNAMSKAAFEELIEIDGVGPVMAENFLNYFENQDNLKEIKKLMNHLTLISGEVAVEGSAFEGKTFVITGSTNIFKNRKEIQLYIERFGGKVVGSVSNNTDFLINNDVESKSSKNKTAKELGVEIINEEDLMKLTGE